MEGALTQPLAATSHVYVSSVRKTQGLHPNYPQNSFSTKVFLLKYLYLEHSYEETLMSDKVYTEFFFPSPQKVMKPTSCCSCCAWILISE